MFAIAGRVKDLPSKALAVACGGVHTACITVDGLFMWGLNEEGLFVMCACVCVCWKKTGFENFTTLCRSIGVSAERWNSCTHSKIDFESKSNICSGNDCRERKAISSSSSSSSSVLAEQWRVGGVWSASYGGIDVDGRRVFVGLQRLRSGDARSSGRVRARASSRH
jgi:hypothetical protein